MNIFDIPEVPGGYDFTGKHLLVHDLGQPEETSTLITPIDDIREYLSLLDFYKSDGTLSDHRNVDADGCNLSFSSVALLALISDNIAIDNPLMYINSNNLRAIIGDKDFNWGGTKVDIDADNYSIRSYASWFDFTDPNSGDDPFLYMDNSSVQFKHINFQIRDNNNYPWMLVNPAAHQMSFGDISYAANSTKLWVDDASEIVGVKADEGFAVKGSQDPSKHYALFKTDNIDTTDVYLQLPKANTRTLLASINGVYADANGNAVVSIPAAQVQSNWTASSGLGVILNKPTLATVATSGAYADLSGKPTIPAAQVQSDWNASSGLGVILNKPTIPAGVTNSQYSPTFTNKSNVTSVSSNVGTLEVLKSGNTVTVYGILNIRLTATGSLGSFDISLPYTAVATGYRCAATGTSTANTIGGISAQGIVTTGTVQIMVNASDTNNNTYSFMLTYTAA